MGAARAFSKRHCPLLVTTPNGLRCSVNAADVRPLCGAAPSATSAFGLGSRPTWRITLAAFIALRIIGYPVSYLAVAWPPAWSHINEARSRYFLQQGRDALTAGNIKERRVFLRARA